MKPYLKLLLALLLFGACQKKIDVPEDRQSINGDYIESNNGVFLLPCHSTTFTTSYPIQAGKVPPFRFNKTHYTSGRVKTINMLSRANPIHPAFKPQAWEVIGTFTYNLKGQAYFTGTKQLWEYYKTSTGAAARRSVVKKNVSLVFYFHTDDNPEHEGALYFRGYVQKVYNAIEKQDALYLYAFGGIKVLPGSDEPEAQYNSGPSTVEDGLFTIRSYKPANYQTTKLLTFKTGPYDGSGKKYSYQPTQNWISIEYTLCEVMQWLVPGFLTPDRQRSCVSVEFYPYGNATKVVQSQVYKNHKYDSKGNLLSYTYADNVLQKTTWLCK
jgi:hypothetical protein